MHAAVDVQSPCMLVTVVYAALDSCVLLLLLLLLLLQGTIIKKLPGLDKK
jgi:hypothetical protein